MKPNHYNSHRHKSESHFTFDQLVKLTIAYNKIKGAGLIKLVPNQTNITYWMNYIGET